MMAAGVWRAARLMVVALGLAGAVAAGGGAARAEDGWRPFTSDRLKGAVYAAGGDDVFLLACDPDQGTLLQVSLPASTKAQGGRGMWIALGLDGRRFGYRGSIVEAADGGAPAAIATVKAGDPFITALKGGRSLRIGKAGANGADVTVPLENAGAALAYFSTSCDPRPSPTTATTAPAQPPATPPTAATVPAAPATAEAPAAKQSAPVAIPPAQDLAAAIFVDKAEGRRVASKLKITPLDLNEDGADELVVTLNDPGWCEANGCTYFVVALTGGPRILGQFIGFGITPAKTRTDGWRDLTLRGPESTERLYYRDGGYH